MIPGITNFNTWEGRYILRHPELNTDGKRNRMLGRGTFARVYQSRNPKRVLKVTTDKMAYWAHVETVYPLKGKYFPKLFKDHGVIGQLDGYDVYMVELERLKTSCTATDKLPASVNRKVSEWANSYGDACCVDIHQDNVMIRPRTGDPVCSDPVCDMEQLNTQTKKRDANRRAHW